MTIILSGGDLSEKLVYLPTLNNTISTDGKDVGKESSERFLRRDTSLHELDPSSHIRNMCTTNHLVLKRYEIITWCEVSRQTRQKASEGHRHRRESESDRRKDRGQQEHTNESRKRSFVIITVIGRTIREEGESSGTIFTRTQHDSSRRARTTGRRHETESTTSVESYVVGRSRTKAEGWPEVERLALAKAGNRCRLLPQLDPTHPTPELPRPREGGELQANY